MARRHPSCRDSTQPSAKMTWPLWWATSGPSSGTERPGRISRARSPALAGVAEMTINLHVNGELRRVDADPRTPLLYVLRNELNLNGAKFGCGLGQCGACTVLIG